MPGLLLHLIRLLPFSLIWLALGFFIRANKEGFQSCDIVITYILLLGTVSLEVFAILMILFSARVAVFLHGLARPQSLSCWETIRKNILDGIKKIKWNSEYTRDEDPTASAAFSFRRFMQQHRFSQSLHQNNLISVSVHLPRTMLFPVVAFKFLLRRSNFDGTMETAEVTSSLKHIVFQKLKEKSKAHLKYSSDIAPGWILRGFEDYLDLKEWFDDFEFDKALLVWHMATDLCYIETATTTCEGNSINGGDNSLRAASKLLSDYLFFLLANERKMLSPIAGIYDLRILCTTRELRKLFDLKEIPRINLNKKKKKKKSKDEAEDDYETVRKSVCEAILNEDDDTSLDPSKEKLSVLSDARKLATQLRKLEENRKWEIISRVLIEFLSYAALRSAGSSHAAKLCKGGEFLTSVWMLCAHFGLGKQYEMEEEIQGNPI